MTSERMLTPRLGALQEWLWNHNLTWMGNRLSDLRYHLWLVANRELTDELACEAEAGYDLSKGVRIDREDLCRPS